MKNNNLSWSYSRATLLYYCAKKYYFNYYTSYLKTFDWDFYKESLILKNLGSMGMWLGNVSHGMLSDYLHLVKTGNSNEKTIAELKKNTLLEMEEIYEKAKIKDFNEYDKDFKFGFSEHFYGENIDPDFLEGKAKIIRYFDNFVASDVHDEIISFFSPKNTVFVEPKIPNFDLMKYQINQIPDLKGIVLRAQPDLGIIVPGESGKKTRYIIYDRKTGKVPEKDKDSISDQLKIYAYKMLLKIGLDKFETIEIFCYEVFLQNMTIFGGQVHDSDIKWIEGKIIQDVTEQKKLLVNQNHIKNQPMPVDFFARTEHKNKCNYCRFRKVCGELENYEKKTARLF